jgi:nucleoside 2-deoxyribosyltransferase
VKLYLAHNFAARTWLREKVLPLLEKAGFECCATWITDDAHVDPGNGDYSASMDYLDILHSDGLLLFTDQFGERPGRGKFVELGLAIGFGKPVVLIGKGEGCVFYNLKFLHRYDTVEDFLLAHPILGTEDLCESA